MESNRSSFNKVEHWIWLTPCLLLLTIFVYVPFLKTFYNSFFLVDYRSIPRQFVGLDNFKHLFADPIFLRAIRNSLFYMLITVPAALLLGTTFAMLTRVRTVTSVLYETIFSIPCAISSSVIALIFQLLYMPTLGLINKLIGEEIRWLYDQRFALYALAVIQVWSSSGFVFVFALTALRNIPACIIESARLDGASKLCLCTKILLPLISPTLLYLLFVNCVTSLMMMSYSNILTGGGPQYSTMTLVQYIYTKYISTGNSTLINSASVVSFLISAGVISIVLGIGKKGSFCK